MILKIDHLSFCPVHFPEALARFESWGYTIQFLDSDLPNPGIKREFMKAFPATHSIALLASPGSTNLELIDHGQVSGQDGYMTPVFEEPRDGVQHRTINSVIIKTNRVEESAAFWSLLGFRRISGQNGREALEFQSLFDPGGLRIYLEEDMQLHRTNYLDDCGFNCVALISNSAERERDRLKRVSCYVTALETIRVNKQDLSVFFTRGPAGELVEIIGLPRNQR